MDQWQRAGSKTTSRNRSTRPVWPRSLGEVLARRLLSIEGMRDPRQKRSFVLIASSDRSAAFHLALRARTAGLWAADVPLARVIDAARRMHPDWVVLDAHLGSVDTRALMAQLAWDPATRNPRIAVTRGTSDRVALAKCGALGLSFMALPPGPGLISELVGRVHVSAEDQTPATWVEARHAEQRSSRLSPYVPSPSTPGAPGPAPRTAPETRRFGHPAFLHRAVGSSR